MAKADKQTTITSHLSAEDKVKVERLFLDAEKAKINEDAEDALKNYRDVLAIDKTNHNAHFQIATILFGNGKFAEAKDEVEQATKLDPKNKWYLELLANAYMRLSNTKDAIKTFEQLIKNNPNDPDNYFDLSYLYLQTNQPEMAIKTYDQFEKNYGLEESVILQKEKIYLKMNKFDNAVSEIKKLVDNYPGEVQYLGMLAELYSLNNKKEQAAEVYQKILELEPDNPQAIMATADYSAAKGDTAARFESLKKIFANPKMNVDTKIKMLYPYIQYYELKKDKIAEAQELADILATTHPDQAKAFAIQGDLYYLNQKEDKALAAYQKSLALKKDIFSVWQQVMAIYNSKQEWKALDKVCDEAMELFPNQAVLYLYKGGAQYQQKDYEKALRSYQKGERMAPDNLALRAQMLSNLGDTYHSLNRYTESDSAYEQSLKLDPENAYVLNNYSYYLSLRKVNLERAKQMSAYAVKLNPESDSFLDTYAWVLFQMGNYTDAKIWQEKALEKNSKSNTLLEHFGDILSMLGDSEKAMAYWKKAKEAGSDSKTLDAKISGQKYIE